MKTKCTAKEDKGSGSQTTAASDTGTIQVASALLAVCRRKSDFFAA